MSKYEGLKLASDIEGVGFYDVIYTKDDIHCLCSVDVESQEVYLFHNHPELDNSVVVDPYDNKTYTIPPRKGTLDEGVLWWEEVTNNKGTLIIHNAHTYDRPVLDKIWPDNKIPFNSYHDTFVQSKVQWFERPCPKGCKSPHGLKAYGVKAGVNKPEVTDWKSFDAFKLHRCIEDCKIQAFTYTYLEKERTTLKDKYGIDFEPALKIEALYAAECFIQELTGAKWDIEWAQSCIKDLDAKIEALRIEIEPQLPCTIKGATGRVSKSEVAALLGFENYKFKDPIVQVKRNGEIVNTVEKPFYKPTVNFTNTVKGVSYSGFCFEYGYTPSFKMKKQLTDWIKDKHPDTKVKDWDIKKEESEEQVLNKYTCEYFGLDPTDTHIVSGAFTRISIEPSTLTQNEVVKSFLIKLGWKHAEEWNLKTDFYDNKIKVDKVTEVRWPEKASPENQLVTVIPKGGYLVSSPKLGEDDYDQLPEGLGKKIAEYNTYSHRRRFLENVKDPDNKGVMSYLRDDGRIPCGVNNFATRSGRASHRVWVNAPSGGALYGENIRKCIIAEEGKVLVGVDMKSAQLSIAAYYANNEHYYESVAVGQEEDESHNYLGNSAHCVNARMFGMVSHEEWQAAIKGQNPELLKSIGLRRNKSKRGSFAVIFGASGKKVAISIGIPEKEGHQRREQFLREMGLDSTISKLSDLEKTYKFNNGFYLPLAFGYWLWNNSSHKSVNTIVQGFEALAQKMTVIRISQVLKEKGLYGKARRIIDYHDEVLFEVEEGYEDEIGSIVGDAYTWSATKIYEYHCRKPSHFCNYEPPKFSIDLNGGYKVGKNYMDVH